MNHIWKLTSPKVFVESLPEDEFLIESLRQSITMYPQEIEKLTRLVPSMFPDGLSLLKGSLFCFGLHADDIKVLKIHKANNNKTLENLDKNADVDNIGEERNVGSFNYVSTVKSRGEISGICILPCCS